MACWQRKYNLETCACKPTGIIILEYKKIRLCLCALCQKVNGLYLFGDHDTYKLVKMIHQN